MQIELTEEMWTDIWETQFSSTNSLSWRDFCWKSVVRFFITPKQKSKQTRTPLPCWRDCGSTMVDHAHVFWTCPHVMPFWEEVSKLISKILGFDVGMSFLFLYLGLIPKDLNASDIYLIKIFMAASKKTITRHWLQKHCPPVDTFINIVNQLHQMEQLTYNLRLQKERGEKLWGKWVLFLAHKD